MRQFLLLFVAISGCHILYASHPAGNKNKTPAKGALTNVESLTAYNFDSKLTFSFNAGAAYRLDEWLDVYRLNPYTNEGLFIEEYQDRLQWGFSYQLEMQYYFSDNIGLGLRFHQFSTSNTAILQVQDVYGTFYPGYLKDNITLNDYGVTYHTRLKSGPRKKHSVHMGVGLNYQEYHNNAAVFEAYEINGVGVGVNLDLSYYIPVYKGFELGLIAAYQSSILVKHDHTFASSSFAGTLPTEEEYRDINLLRLGIGIRFSE